MDLADLKSGRLNAEDYARNFADGHPPLNRTQALIEAILPRRTTFTRKEAWRRAVAQVIAANVDTVFLVTAFGGDVNPRRLERYLTGAWDSGADPVVRINGQPHSMNTV